MLSSIRKQARSWIVKVLFAVLILAFAVWGIGDVFRRAQAPDPILSVDGGFEYSPADFDREMKLSLQRLSQTQGLQITPEMFAALGGAQQLVDQAERKGLIGAYADRLGIEIPLAAAVQTIQNDRNFANEGGGFDRTRLEYALRQMGLSEAEYVAITRRQIRDGQVLGALLGPLSVPAPLTRALYLFQNEQRSAELVVVPTAGIDAGEPDEAALQKFHADHADTYMAPEYRTATLVTMQPSDFVQDVSVSEEEMRQEYEARKSEFSSPATREVEQSVTQDQAVADKIVAEVKAGIAFADAVKAATGGAPVSLGRITQEKLPAEIADAVFQLAADAVSPPLQSPFGIHVVHVLSRTEAATRTFDDVKGELRNGLALGKAADAMESVREQLEDELAGGASLEEAAITLKLRIEKIASVDSSGKDSEEKDLGLASDTLGLIFNTEAGEPGLVTALGDGSYAVVQVRGITTPALRPFDRVKDRVKADWIAARQRDLAKEKADALADKVKSAGDLAAEATALGLVLKVTKPFYRNEGDPESGVDAALAASLFKLKVGETIVGAAAEGSIVARLSAVIPAQPEAHQDELADLAQRVRQSLAGDLADQFHLALKAEMPVERNDSEWQRLIQSAAP